MAVPKKRRSKSKKRFKKQCWKKKAEPQAKKAYSTYKIIFEKKNDNNTSAEDNSKFSLPS